MSTVFMSAAALALLLILLARVWWRNTVIRKSLSLSDEIVRMLTKRETEWLHRGLTVYLGTPEGATLAGDPRVAARVALFEERLQAFRDRLAISRHDRARRAAGLPKLPVNDEKSHT